jgi:light-regulated signal transduction histidine kinase (bacteriophytochrome)
MQKIPLNAEEKYRILFDSIDEGFCIIEMIFDEHNKPIDYRFLEINNSFERQTGLYNAIGKRMREFAPNHEEHWFEIYGKIALTGESIRFENRAEQLHRWYDVYAFRFGDPKNMQVAILFNDISERRQTEENLKIANKELESFSYIVAHDLRAPLRAINGYAKILEDEFKSLLDDEGQKILGAVRYNAQKMGNLIDDLLAFAKIGKGAVKETDIDMDKLTNEVLPDLKNTSSNKANIKIARLHPAKGDYALIKQVMTNLLSNAIKYSSKKTAPAIEIASEVKNNQLIYTVKDNGDGFDMKYIDKLFGVFQRLHTSEEFEGTGVGLAIVQRIIARHGGTVSAESELGKGATFRFMLPLNESPASYS